MTRHRIICACFVFALTAGPAYGQSVVPLEGSTPPTANERFGGDCAGDLDHDGDVDLGDLGLLLQAYGKGPGGDADGDGNTDLSDLGVVLQQYGATCPERIDPARSFWVDCSDFTGVPSTAFGAALGIPGTWNLITGAGDVGLLDLMGRPSDVTLTMSSGLPFAAPFSVNGNKTPPGSDHEKLMDDILDTGFMGAVRSAIINGLPAGSYRVIVYAGAPDSAGLATAVSVDDQRSQTVTGHWPQPFDYALGATHAEFEVMLAEDSALQIELTSLVGAGSVNGLQIVGLE